MGIQGIESRSATEDGEGSCAQDRAAMDALTYRIIGAGHKVSTVLGTGFLEKVYENALAVELRRGGLAVQQQPPVEVRYDAEIVGLYTPDLLVERRVIVELKVAACLDRTHRMQCLHYLRATGLRLCLLVNFGNPRLEVRRIINGRLDS